MTERRPAIALDEVAPYIRRRCFSPTGRDRVGAELEWITVPQGDRSGYPNEAALDDLATAEPSMAGGSKLTMEPGGQLELSSPPARDLGSLLLALDNDLDALTVAARERGLELLGVGMHPARGRKRLLDTPRYRAMEAYYERVGPAGARMMCNTAAIQVNLDLGANEDEAAARWRLAHSLGPVLGAIFADSPVSDGRPTGWRSTRLANWWEVDPSRTLPVGGVGDPAMEWTRYALEANVMMISAGPDRIPLTRPLSFRTWLEEGHETGYPTWDDLDLHLTTLFPPVRPRGWLELRMIDALPGPLWRVAVVVATALFYDRSAASAAAEVTESLSGRWADGFRFGAQHPDFRAAGEACLDLAVQAAGRMGVPQDAIEQVKDFKHRYTSCGLTPADETLNAWVVGRVTSVNDPEREAAWS